MNWGSNEYQNRPRLRSRNSFWREVIGLVLLVALVYTPINLMTARAIVRGPSMQPTFWTDQRVIVNRAAYYFGSPARGDVIVLHNPSNPEDDDLIKRVIGLPGETVEIREGRVHINGVLIDEPYIKAVECRRCINKAWVLGAEEYFVMGDNRNDSRDSRDFNAIHKSLIVGQAWVRYWPPQDFAFIHHPDYPAVPDSYILPSPTPSPTFDPARVTPNTEDAENLYPYR
jgi:signal peptidase I